MKMFSKTRPLPTDRRGQAIVPNPDANDLTTNDGEKS
jgi:hypothetical protein